MKYRKGMGRGEMERRQEVGERGKKRGRDGREERARKEEGKKE